MDPETVSNPVAIAASAPERREAHNASINQVASEEGACAQVHLPTGRVCTQQHGHEGSCDFVSADQVNDSLSHRQVTEGW